MSYKYTSVNGGNGRPTVKVTMSSLDRAFVEYPYMLVDSGADITVINLELAQLLEVDIKTCRKGFFEHHLVSFNGRKKTFSIESPYSV